MRKTPLSLLRKTLFCFSVTLFSLNTLNVKLMIASIASMLMLATISVNYINFKKIKISFHLILFFLILNLLVIVTSFIAEVYLNTYIKFILIQVYFFFAVILFLSDVIDINLVRTSCRFIILFHFLFFSIQLIYYFWGGDFIDFNNYIRDDYSDSWYVSKALEGQFIDVRGCGLFSEPSFYAMTVLPPSAFLLANKKLNKYSVIGILSSIISLSIAAIIVSITLMLSFVFLSKKIKLIYYVCFLLFFIIASPFLYQVYDLRVNQSVDYDAVGSRTKIFQEFKSRSEINNFLGSGVFLDDNKPIGVTKLDGYQTRDSSFLIYLFFSFGVVGVLFFIVMLSYLFRDSLFEFCLFFPLMAFKYHITHGMLWILFLFFYFFVKIKSRCSKGARI